MMKETTSIKKEFTIQNKLGLHARPVAMFVKCANKFQSEITVEKNNESVNGKSIMGVMMLAAECGSELTVISTGPDAGKAIEEIERIVSSKFGEE